MDLMKEELDKKISVNTEQKSITRNPSKKKHEKSKPAETADDTKIENIAKMFQDFKYEVNR